MEPVTVLTAGAIAKIAFEEFAKAGGGELAKKSLGGAIDLVKALRDKIQAKFKGNDRAETAIAEAEQQPTPVALEKVTKYLDLEMLEDEAFATEIKQIAQQIINVQNTSGDRTYNQTAGRDIFNVDNAGQSNRFGGS
ncbi:MAG: hypothetical protein H7Z11_23085 [Verrucomicrobia bacterium]|nr:hypothetical protein [Leptolyngbya sp. ES-bin-22]